MATYIRSIQIYIQVTVVIIRTIIIIIIISCVLVVIIISIIIASASYSSFTISKSKLRILGDYHVQVDRGASQRFVCGCGRLSSRLRLHVHEMRSHKQRSYVTIVEKRVSLQTLISF